MTFDELEHDVIHGLASNIVLNYSKMSFCMTIKPDVTDNKTLLGKKFQLLFKDVIFVSADHTSLISKEGQLEFISWGKFPVNCCRNGKCKLFEELYKREWNHDMMRVKREDFYTHYFFQNILGNEINLLAKGVGVGEIEKQL